MKKLVVFVGLMACAHPALGETTCHGEGAYRVCTTVTQRADGSMSVRSYDTQGNTYNMDTDVYTKPNGDMEVRSYDSEGNSYSMKSWSDSSGSHSRDSEGNTCSILNDGTVIGCD